MKQIIKFIHRIISSIFKTTVAHTYSITNTDNEKIAYVNLKIDNLDYQYEPYDFFNSNWGSKSQEYMYTKQSEIRAIGLDAHIKKSGFYNDLIMQRKSNTKVTRVDI
ncbi:hypothetical protein Barb7_01390 [Bacteroidales bacterium Barb7]|nr:hypothetical protein Barb7_01390 [Bacteroidales bacterium Barb7]